jgi:hypothetical protein
VLVTGGNSENGGVRAEAELYDPSTGAWTPTSSMMFARFDHTASLLNNGQVLVAGGDLPPNKVAEAELYDPDTGGWTLTGALHIPCDQHTANLLPDGTVVVAGGNGENYTNLRSTEIYAPATGLWTNGGKLTVAMPGPHTGTSLQTGRVLVTGGFQRFDGNVANLGPFPRLP